MAEIVIQDCGCIAIPEEIAVSMRMLPGTQLNLTPDAASRSITLTALGNPSSATMPALAACPINL